MTHCFFCQQPEEDAQLRRWEGQPCCTECFAAFNDDLVQAMTDEAGEGDG